MTVEELIIAGKDYVRSNPTLMSAYIETFGQIFGRKPDCAGCTFQNDWQRLVNSQTIKIQKEMSNNNNSFILRDQHKIYTYIVEDKKNKIRKPIRTYGNLMTEEFAESYLSIGDEQTIEARKSEFKVLPSKLQDVAADLSAKKIGELKEIATQKEYPIEEWQSLKKDDLIAYIEAKELDIEVPNDDDVIVN